MITELEIEIIKNIIQNKEHYLKSTMQDLVEDSEKYQIKKIGCMKCNVSFVQYQPTFLSYFPINGQELGFSDEFSGCTFVKFTTNKGDDYIGHISRESGSDWNDELWENFVNDAGIIKYSCFKPYAGKTKDIYEETALKAQNSHFLNCLGIFCDGIFYSGIYDKNLKDIVYLEFREYCHESFLVTLEDGDIIFDKTKELYHL